jgi:hypothetical protein
MQWGVVILGLRVGLKIEIFCIWDSRTQNRDFLDMGYWDSKW